MLIEVAGENALIVYFGETANPQVSARVQQAVDLLAQTMGDALVDLVPSYASLLVIYNPLVTDHFAVKRQIRELQYAEESDQPQTGNLIELPVYYGTDAGPDLQSLADNAGLTTNEVIQIHSEMEYRVYAIGFAPGFAYLGEVDERIAVARLSTPRLKVPRGAVAIADRQTAVYPAVSPGGWNLIGLCPIRMFDPAAEPTMPVQVGDRVKFAPISKQEFLSLGGEL